MGTVIYYHCREQRHLAAPSRMGLGGIVFRHGTAAYCDGIGVDGAHHWVPTGGVPIETLFTTQMQRRERDDDDPARWLLSLACYPRRVTDLRAEWPPT